MNNETIRMEKERNKKILWVLIPLTIAVIILTIVVGIFANKTGGKIPVSANKFAKICAHHSILTQDVKDKLDRPELFKNAFISVIDENDSLYFLEFKDKNGAKAYFASAAGNMKTTVKNLAEDDVFEKNLENYSYYIAETDESYIHIVRVANTVVFANVDEDNEDIVEKIINIIGY